jgi:Fe-S oxidoreductase
VRRGLLEWNTETANLLYQCADCGLCRAFCVTDQPLPQAIVTARAEVAAAGRAPAAVAEVDAALRRWGNPYAVAPSTLAKTERCETALFVGAAALHREWASTQAAQRLLEHAGIGHGLAALGRSSGYLAYTLGLHQTARALAQATLAELEQLGCRRLLVLAPEQAYTLRYIYPLLGVPLPEQIEVIELTVLLSALLDEGRLRLRAAPLDLAYHDPCQTPRIEGRWHAPRRLLAGLTTLPLGEGFWREKRASNCGASGGLPWTQPVLAATMAKAALADAGASGGRLIVTDAPNCLAHLRAVARDGVEVRGLYEVLADRLEARDLSEN